MPKALRLLALGAIVAAPLNGQVSLGVVAGASSSNWKYSTGCQDCEHPLTQFAGGVSMAVPIGHRFALTPEVLYLEKGSSLDFPGNLRIALRIHYFEGSALLRYSLPRVGMLRPFVIAGPELAIRVACSAKLTNSPANGGGAFTVPCTTTDTAIISEDEPDRGDYGLMFGAGAAFRRLSASVRYDLGLQDVFSLYGGSGGTVKSRAWLLLVAVRL